MLLEKLHVRVYIISYGLLYKQVLVEYGLAINHSWRHIQFNVKKIIDEIDVKKPQWLK